MESLVRITGIAAPLLRANIDTDQIIPTRFMIRLTEEGLGDGLFAEWRVRPDGSHHPEFVLTPSPWDRAQILVAGPNFGCGSSREAAPRALRQRGFRAIIAPSFGDIFYGNCFRSGIVPVRLPKAVTDDLGAQVVSQMPQALELSVDLEAGTVCVAGQAEVHRFSAPPLLRLMLLEGLDEIELTRRRAPRIAAFRHDDRQRRPWAYL